MEMSGNPKTVSDLSGLETVSTACSFYPQDASKLDMDLLDYNKFWQTGKSLT